MKKNIIPNIRELSDACISEIARSIIRERKIRNSPKFQLDPIQKSLIDSTSKFVRVLAPAGAGKTRTLLAKAEDLIKQSQDKRVLCLTFTNAAANEFKERAIDLSPVAQNRLIVSTLNSFGKRLSDSSVNDLRTITPGSRDFGLVCNIIKSLVEDQPWINKSDRSIYRSIYEFSDLMKTLGFHHKSSERTAQLHLGLNEQFGMGPLIFDALNKIGYNDLPHDHFIDLWLPLWRKLTAKLWERKIVSLEDQKYWGLELLIENQIANNWLQTQDFAYVLVDEFQDINKLDLLFIQQICATLDAGLIIVGDDDQCIYEWRGCSSEFILNPQTHMSSLCSDHNFETIILENNYRCPKNIVKYANKLIDHNENREPKKMNPVCKEEANVKIIPLPASFVTLNVIDRLLENIEASHPKHTVAVVGRKKCQLIPIQILLAKRAARFHLDDDLNVFKSDAWDDLRSFLFMIPNLDLQQSASLTIDNVERLLHKTQKTKFSKHDILSVKKLLEKSKPKNLRSAINLFGESGLTIRKGYAKPSEIATRLLHFFQSDNVTTALLRAGETFKGFAKDFGKAKDDIFYTDPPFSHLADLAVGYYSDFQSFINDMDTAAENLPTSTDNSAKIEVMTALRTKGREFDTVIVLDTNDGIWPNKLSEVNGHLEEERRLFYVTITRAKNNLLMFESGRVQGKRMQSSRFLQEMGVSSRDVLTNEKLENLSECLLRELKI